MNKLKLALLVAIAVVGFVAAAAIARSSSGTVSLRKTRLGSVLVNSKGRTLYLFAKDRNGKSSCTGTCAVYWPPLVTRAKPTAGSGVKAALLGTTKRADGRLQVTYNRHPLYTYAGDKSAGQTTGQGLNVSGGKWWAVSAAGAAVKTHAGTTTTTTTGGTTTYSTTYSYP